MTSWQGCHIRFCTNVPTFACQRNQEEKGSIVLAILTGSPGGSWARAGAFRGFPICTSLRTSNRDVQLSSNSLTFQHVVVMLSSIMKSFPKSPTIAVLRSFLYVFPTMATICQILPK
jgi:hypothetical protein